MLVRHELRGECGKKPEERTVEELLRFGVVILDKPGGPTSHQAVAWCKKALGIPKAGHSGTLDPAATGVLLVALGESTKTMPCFSGLEKEYVAVMHVHADMEEDAVGGACDKFVGTIKQLPPVRSAVARRVRERRVYGLEVLEIAGRDAMLRVKCEAGTYVRKLVHDIGESLGCGAHMSELRRTRVGGFTDGDAVTLQDIVDALWFWRNKGDDARVRKYVMGVEAALERSGTKRVFIKDSAVPSVRNGAAVGVGGVAMLDEGIETGQCVAIMALKGSIVAIGISQMASGQMHKAAEGVAVNTDRVLLEKNA